MNGLSELVKCQIALLAGDDLEDEQSAEVRRSIEACPHCRQHWVRMRGCVDILDRVGKAEETVSGPSLWPAVESRLRPTTRVRAGKFNGWVPALSMAAACMALLAAGQMDGLPPQEFAVDEAVLFSGDVSAMPSVSRQGWVPQGSPFEGSLESSRVWKSFAFPNDQESKYRNVLGIFPERDDLNR